MKGAFYFVASVNSGYWSLYCGAILCEKEFLVFDDDENIRSFLWQMLDKRGYEVFTFPEPGSCLLNIKDNCDCPVTQACGDIILSDVDMPNISGFKIFS
jgi:DNA-binding NtrC family response regulator